MNLIDVHGQPLRKNDLKKEMAHPTTTGVRQVLNSHSVTGLNPQALASAMRRAERGDMDRYLSIAEEIEEKDGHYLSVLGTRKRAVTQLEITVEAASDDKVDQDNADLIKSWLERDQLEDELFDILDAIGKGFSFTEIMWDLSSDVWLPQKLKWRDPRWFEFDQTDGETPLLKDDGGCLPLAPYKFIFHTHKAKSGLPIKGGVVRPCSWMYLFKNFSIKDWVIFLEAYGMPIRLGKYHAGASEEDRDVLMKAVAMIGSDAAAIIPESMQVEFVEAHQKSASSDGFEKLAKYCDAQISKAVLGQTMTTDDGSSRSQAEVHDEVREDIERADAKQLMATLNEQLVKSIVILNKGEQKRYPRICIGRTEYVDIEKVANTAATLHGMGMRISEKGLREKTGMPEPESEDDVLQPVIQTPSVPAVSEPDVASSQRKKKDAFEKMADDLAGDYEDVMDPLLAAIQEAANISTGYEDFKQNLLEIASDLEIDGIADNIANVNFFSNIAGQVNADLKED